MNETLKFYGETEMTFPSIVRRSLISNCTREVCQRTAPREPLPGAPRRTFSCRDMKDFVTSQPAAGALFTVVLGELCDFSVATFCVARGSVFQSLVHTGDSFHGSGCVSGRCVCDFKWYVVLSSFD